jgi:2-dehydro-3-deoxyphosphooctonate aldolase (KDO 8-P synthase)
MPGTTRVTAGAVAIGGGAPLALIAGPCVIESEAHASMIAESLVTIASRCGVPLIFKASYDKANRTSLKSFRGPGIEEGLKVLSGIKRRLGVPILTDIHEANQAAPVAEVADVLQIPAFLSRQTDLIVAAAKTGRIINLKKGQFLAPTDMKHAIAKVVESGNPRVFVTERGFSFGYNNLVVDMRAFPMLRALGYPVVYDATHSLQLPGGGDGVTAGQAEYIEPLASAAVAAGIDGLFVEVHDNPPRAKSDAQNALPLERVEPLLRHLMRLDSAARQGGLTPVPARGSVPE